MPFNSVDFAIFLPTVFILYWFVTNTNLALQNLLIAASSLLFYGWWDWRFLFLIITNATTDFVVGKLLEKQDEESKRRFLLFCSLAVNLGILGFFKYFNFFVENFTRAFTFLGYNIHPVSLIVVLPVGISFYTFKSMSYTIDVYKRKLKPTHNVIDYFAFISFFPQLLAGPISRATHLLSQFYAKRTFDYQKAIDGLRQILWGLFKKIVIADNCAIYANMIFDHSTNYNGSTLVLGAIFFTFQIYCDFSGYSDIAIGISRLFGFDIRQNFAFPYFSRDMAEFWRRWHISLTTWFRDYLYFPLGGSRGSTGMKVRNTFIIFLVSGFWHGANWTFIFWGALNALYFLPLLLLNKNRTNLDIIAKGELLPSLKETVAVGITFSLTVFAWIFFRAENISQAFAYIAEIFSRSLFTSPQIMPRIPLLLIAFLIIIEWSGREQQYAIAQLGFKRPRAARWALYYSLLFALFLFADEGQKFIYFQF